MSETRTYTDDELTSMVNYWLDHYTKNGDRHHRDTKEERILEIYYDTIIERVCNELYGTDDEIDALVERINNLF